ncbi:PRC-barrel domain-containing protein [Limimaricola cinnabarinus]|jgi:ribosomal 30S subunit maturation factor RimM|nr:PRC-barrel domain-containing protein [Limimaricola cinnabarinus]
MIRPLRAAALAALIAGPAGAQSPLDSIDGIDGAMGGPIGDAVEKLGEMAADQLLIRDFLGMELTDAEGKTVGTVRDFVAIPGGKLAGALVETSEGTRILVPWQLLSVESADGKAIRATQAAADLTGSQKLVDLASQLSD